MMNKYLILLFIPLFFLACGPSEGEYNDLAKRNRECQEEIVRLKNQIEDLKFGPIELLNAAKRNLDLKNYADAQNNLDMLLSRHPNSEEAKTARDLWKIVIRERRIADQKEQARVNDLLGRLHKKHDPVENITWYHDAASVSTNNSRIYLYFGVTNAGDLQGPRMVIVLRRSTSLSWLFVKQYVFKIDNSKEIIAPASYNDVKRDNNSDSIWETYDIYADDHVLRIVRGIINSKKTIIRYVGDDYAEDRIISSSEKMQMKNILDAYKNYKEK